MATSGQHNLSTDVKSKRVSCAEVPGSLYKTDLKSLEQQVERTLVDEKLMSLYGRNKRNVYSVKMRLRSEPEPLHVAVFGDLPRSLKAAQLEAKARQIETEIASMNTSPYLVQAVGYVTNSGVCLGADSPVELEYIDAVIYRPPLNIEYTLHQIIITPEIDVAQAFPFFFRQVVSAVVELHERGVVLRNLDASKIAVVRLSDRSLCCCLVDLSEARFTADLVPNSETPLRRLTYLPAYPAPEQVAQPLSLLAQQPAVDLFAIGEMCADVIFVAGNYSGRPLPKELVQVMQLQLGALNRDATTLRFDDLRSMPHEFRRFHLEYQCVNTDNSIYHVALAATETNPSSRASGSAMQRMLRAGASASWFGDLSKPSLLEESASTGGKPLLRKSNDRDSAHSFDGRSDYVVQERRSLASESSAPVLASADAVASSAHAKSSHSRRTPSPMPADFPLEAGRLGLVKRTAEPPSSEAPAKTQYGNQHQFVAKPAIVACEPSSTQEQCQSSSPPLQCEDLNEAAAKSEYVVVTTRASDEVIREGPTLETWITSGHWPMASQSDEERQANRAAFERYLWCVLQGVNDSHDAGIVHRDVKPSNCVISASDSTAAKVVYTSDHLCDDQESSKASDENRKNDCRLAPTTAVDIWAVGAMAAEWLYMEQHAVGGKDAWEELVTAKKWESAPLRRAAARGDALALVALRALNADPMQRPTAAEAAKLLLSVVATCGHQYTVASFRAAITNFIEPVLRRDPSQRTWPTRHDVAADDFIRPRCPWCISAGEPVERQGTFEWAAMRLLPRGMYEAIKDLGAEARARSIE